ncbi:MAG TPA: hypothetical protein GXX36_14275 [Clostridiaceae bacterium]|nr:hypothetical protein [Clostridiaceae bacterium]
MRGQFKNAVRIACIYISSVVGAGFASGQEIIKFFTTYYEGGFYGIILAGIIFAAIGGIVLDRVYVEKINNYDEFIYPTFGKVVGEIVNTVVTLFMLSLFSIMIAGMSSILNEKLALSYRLSVVLMACICMLIILGDIRRVTTVSSVITPLLIAGIVIIGLYIIVFKDTSVFSIIGLLRNKSDNWFISSLLYVSYNSILSVLVLCNLLPYLKSRKSAKWGGVLGGLVLCLITLILNATINLFHPKFTTGEIPMLDIVERYSRVLSYVYTFVLWLAMLVSAVNSGFCLVERVSSKLNMNIRTITVIACIVVIPLSCVGFSGLIASIYPMFGYIGLFILTVIIFQWAREIFRKGNGKSKKIKYCKQNKKIEQT